MSSFYKPISNIRNEKAAMNQTSPIRAENGKNHFGDRKTSVDVFHEKLLM